jgi:putative SOS response-associated peptidase YedK
MQPKKPRLYQIDRQPQRSQAPILKEYARVAFGRTLTSRLKRKATLFAAAYDVWKDEARRAITNFADAAPSAAQHHNRMPVGLEDSRFDDWMRASANYPAEMTKPYAGDIDAWELGARSAIGRTSNQN